ncbi:hypothetical protein Q4560_13720 [Celeribacter halophilus]|uniref:hypothetical protein n=1 Tax=Celeribacter halophilus TaxID=576117 RepID=UPI0026E3F5D3|nr:hypothetical protein [Celeribacter halophilus]MDO6724332.1 hypothetical protein [Celeribacter halophilus]
MKANTWMWVARGFCLVILVSILIRNAETGTLQALPIVMMIALVASFVYPLFRHYRQKS